MVVLGDQKQVGQDLRYFLFSAQQKHEPFKKYKSFQKYELFQNI